MPRPGGTGAAKTTEPRQVREEATVRRLFWAPPANLPGCFLSIMETPPVCNYEGSDYQTSFWKQGRRDYEDAAEGVALKRLLPASGTHLLELGAGAGRNTPRYIGFQRVTLVDYSHTQIEQARQRLGANGNYRYVVADIYRLPFNPGQFDAATMIRTLHHMADARAALDQVRAVLQPGAIFVLEFANKRNLKSILRFSLHQQSWNPFTPEPVEFAPLNFDFHPATVRTWLQLSGFAIERQLTVSYLRVGMLKRLLPLKLLVWLDSLLQPSGSLFQFSPSVFVRARVSGQVEALKTLATSFRCPACGAGVPDTPQNLVCPACAHGYTCEDGIYDFRIQE
jgi:ubiquinone/menaquinone biosynthesis C-methylase UbiE